MPTYEFKCPLGHEFERFYRKISDAPAEVRCPECGAVAERQLSAGGGLVFKGSGFYLTDYGKNAHRKPEPKVEGAKAETAKSESAKSESAKPESPKSGGAKSDAAKADSSKAKSESPKPKTEAAKPKKE